MSDHHHPMGGVIARSLEPLTRRYFEQHAASIALPSGFSAKMLEAAFMPSCVMLALLDYNMARVQAGGRLSPDDYVPDWDGILKRCPDLDGVLQSATLDVLLSVSNVWERFQQDLPLLVERGWWDAGASLSEMRILPTGDFHGPAQTVLSVTSSDGCVPIYFKPRSGAKDELLRASFEVLGEGFSEHFHVPESIERQGYQWQKHVARAPGKIDASLVGRLLAFAYFTSFPDLHPGNVALTDSGVCLLDTESFMTPLEAFDKTPRSRIDRIAGIDRDSFASLCVLPLRVGGDIGVLGANWGLWGGVESDASGIPRTHIVDEGGSPALKREIAISEAEVAMKHEQNASIARDFPSFMSGFHFGLHQISDKAPELTALLSRHEDPTRCIFRPTQFYADVIERSYHPAVLAKTRGREVYIEQQLRDSEITKSTSMDFVVYELEELLVGRVPHVECPANGGEILGFSMVSAIEVLNRRLTEASTRNGLHRLEELIRLSTLAFLMPNESPYDVWLPEQIARPMSPAARR